MKCLAHLAVNDFEQLRALCRHDPAFPATELEWARLIGQANDSARSEGYFPETLHLEVDTFRYWCAMVSVAPGIDALKAYAIGKRRLGGASLPPPTATA
jgi:hypothetical protein